MDINEICKAQHRVADLFTLCRDLSGSTMNYYERNRAWFSQLKPILTRYVGFYSTTPELANSDAFDIAYQHCVDIVKI